MKKKLFLFAFLYVFVTLTDLGAQIRGAQTRYTVVNFGLNQPLTTDIIFFKFLRYLLSLWPVSCEKTLL